MSADFYRAFFEVMVPWGALLVCAACFVLGAGVMLVIELLLDGRHHR